MTDDETIQAARRILRRRYRRGRKLHTSAEAIDYLIVHLAPIAHEVFGVLYLDNKHRVIAFEQPFQGTIDGCSVYPRQIVERVLHHNAAAVILAHNHPSGVSEPSNADDAITRRLQAALQLIDVRVLDHIIVAETPYSYSEQGKL